METVYEETEVKIIEEVESCYTLMEVSSSPRKKRRSKGSGDNADKPKKPRSAYLLYYFDVHQGMQQEYPDMPQSEINKRISDSWKRLNVADKGYYLERAKMEKEGMDPNTQSAVTSQDVPGFRKILPRANYVLLPKGSVAEERLGAPLEVCMEAGSDPQGEGLLSEGPPPQEALFSPMALGSEVELAEQCIAIEGLGEDTAVTLGRSGALQGILSQYSSAARHASLPLKEEEPRAVAKAYSTVGVVMEEGLQGSPVVQQVKTEATHLVAILPNQELVENKVIAAASSIMMLPFVTSLAPEPKPSFKLSIKYTRRGRGSCHTPGCSFSYVTRHKPPYCPDCGQHLGGKWVPPTKKAAAKAPALGSKASPRKPRRSPEDSQPPAPASETRGQLSASSPNGATERKEVSETNSEHTTSSVNVQRGASSARKVGRPPWEPKKEVPVAPVRPPEGARINSPDATHVVADVSAPPVIGLSSGKVRVIVQERSGGFGQKRRIRAILPAPANPSPASQAAIVQWIAVPPDKVKSDPKINNRTAKPPSEKISGLKPNTLKQLGHSVPLHSLEQRPPTPISSSQYIVTDNGVKILSMVSFKQNSGSPLALGLSTARGRGRCKNPSCDYIYKNRHKPPHCPDCGWELTKKPAQKPELLSGAESDPGPAGLLDPYQPLSAAQRETQRQSTLQLLRRSLQIPESEAELHEVLALVQELGSAREAPPAEGETPELQRNGWPRSYEPAATHCALCQFPLFKGGPSSVAGQEDCWLLTDSHIQTASIQLKICLNSQCLALHSFTDIHPGLFNVGNKLLVSLDLFFKIRNQIRLGHDPAQAALAILSHVQNQPVHALGPEELTHIQELLCSGYWAFECLTMRDYNDMICGVCGIAPKLEIAQHNANNVLQLSNVEFTWPDFQAPDEVHVDDFWLTMESEALEQAAFPSSIPITRFDASIIAPFIPPLMRNAVVINTEKDKITTDTPQRGDLSVLVRLIHEGQLKPEQIDQHSEEELRQVLECCGAPAGPDSTKEELLVCVCSLYSHIQNGLATAPQPPAHLTAGKLSKICPHQVVCGSKYMVRRESARDHVDLLVSSRFWPPVYVTDAAQQVALCTDVQYPELASQMWGRNQGCFSDPMCKPEYVSCAELQDQQYGVDLSAVESSQVHPVTKSPSRWVVHPGVIRERGDPPGEDPHHAMTLCKELEPYVGLVAGLEEEKEEEEEADADADAESPAAARRRPLAFDNAAYYYLYNRLVDFLSSRDIVSGQIGEVLRACQPGEVVIRDALYRLGVAQINTENEEEEEEEEETEGDGGGAVVMEEVVLE